MITKLTTVACLKAKVCVGQSKRADKYSTGVEALIKRQVDGGRCTAAVLHGKQPTTQIEIAIGCHQPTRRVIDIDLRLRTGLTSRKVIDWRSPTLYSQPQKRAVELHHPRLSTLPCFF